MTKVKKILGAVMIAAPIVAFVGFTIKVFGLVEAGKFFIFILCIILSAIVMAIGTALLEGDL